MLKKVQSFITHYLNDSNDKTEKIFIKNVFSDIEDFLLNNNGMTVLIFPPMNNRQRYLIHKIGEVYSLDTFSIGEGLCRLTVVSPPSQGRLAYEPPLEMTKSVEHIASNTRLKKQLRPDAPLYVPPAVRKAQVMSNREILEPDHTKKICTEYKQISCSLQMHNPAICTKSDALIVETQFIESTTLNKVDINELLFEVCHADTISDNYRVNDSFHDTPETVKNMDEILYKFKSLNLPDSVDKPIVLPVVTEERSYIDKIGMNDILKNDNTNNVAIVKHSNEKVKSSFFKLENNYGTDNGDKCAVKADKAVKYNSIKWPDKLYNKDEEEMVRASEEINRRNKRIMKSSSNTSNVLIISDPVENILSTDAVDNWEDLVDNEGLLDSTIIAEINKQVGNVVISKAKEDYKDFKSKPILDMDLSHVVEIYGFPPNFQTRDLLTIFGKYKNGTYHIKWVDDTHALGIFSSKTVACEVLKTNHELIKLRPMSEASKQSVNKANRYPTAMQPVIVRPQTCPQTARRMVTGALGIKLSNAKEEREKEKKILKEARDQKRLAAKQQDDAWEGRPSSTSASSLLEILVRVLYTDNYINDVYCDWGSMFMRILNKYIFSHISCLNIYLLTKKQDISYY